MRLIHTMGLAAALLTTGAAAAQSPTGPYLQFSGATAKISREIGTDDTYEADKFTLGIAGGWQFNDNIGVEVGYLRPSAIKETFTDGTNVYDLRDQFGAWTATAIVSVPLDKVMSLYVRLGAVQLREKARVEINNDATETSTDTVTEAFYGAGLGLMVKDVRFRFEYQRAKFDYGHVALLSLGVSCFLSPRR